MITRLTGYAITGDVPARRAVEVGNASDFRLYCAQCGTMLLFGLDRIMETEDEGDGAGVRELACPVCGHVHPICCADCDEWHAGRCNWGDGMPSPADSAICSVFVPRKHPATPWPTPPPAPENVMRMVGP